MAIANTGIEIIVSASVCALSAQLVKLVGYYIQHRQLDFKLFVQTGGMPSSHTATMASLATGVGLISGFTSVDFAIALGIAMVVMYDAAGVRRAAGRMAGILNKMTEDFYKHHPEHLPDRIRELLGHTPFEVFIGAIYGCVLTIALHEYLMRAAL